MLLSLSMLAANPAQTPTKTIDIPAVVTQAVKNYSHENNDTGILMLFAKGDKRVKAAAGLADRESKRPIRTDDLFEIGSASKVFTGVAIFQLIEEGKLSLDTKLNTLYKEGEITKLANYKGKNYWDEVTVGMLLQHTSGFVDYFNVYGDDSKALEILGGKGKHYNFEKLIHLSVEHGDANFKPGERFKYCNTGYIILGDIISKVSGMDWHDYIQTHILDKVGMKHTYFGTRIPQKLRDTMPKGYFASKEAYMPPSLADSAGEIISTLDDLADFMQAWGSGKLYSKKETLQTQLTRGFHLQTDKYDNMYYGYAIMKIENFYGHGGQTLGFQSYMAIDPKTDVVYVIGVNDSQVLSLSLFWGLSGAKPHLASGE